MQASLLTLLGLGVYAFTVPEEGSKPDRVSILLSKLHAPPRYSMVVAGDSTVHQGVSPMILEAASKIGKILNFGFPGAGYNEEFLEKTYQTLEKSNKLKVIVLGITAHSLTRTAASRSLEHTLNRASKPSLRLEKFCQSLFPRFNAAGKLPKSSRALRLEQSQMHFNLHEDGWAEASPLPNFSNTHRMSQAQWTKTLEGLSVDFESIERIEAACRRWRSEGILVCAYSPPLSLGFQELAYKTIGSSQQQLRDRIISAGGNWLELDSTQLTYYDGVHLDKESAIIHSKRLGAAIATILGNE